MANETYKGIEVGGIVYDNEDETARGGVSENATSIGNLSNLETEEKSNIVGSLNEVLENIKDYSMKELVPDSITADSSHSVTLSVDKEKFPDKVYINFGILINGNSYQEVKAYMGASMSSNGVYFAFGNTQIIPLVVRIKGDGSKIFIVLKEGITSLKVYLLNSSIPSDSFEISMDSYSYQGEVTLTSVGSFSSTGTLSGSSSYRSSGWSESKARVNWNNKYLILFDDGDYAFVTLNSLSGSFVAYARSGSESVSGTTLTEFHGITVASESGGAFRKLSITKAGQVIQFV